MPKEPWLLDELTFCWRKAPLILCTANLTLVLSFPPHLFNFSISLRDMKNVSEVPLTEAVIRATHILYLLLHFRHFLILFFNGLNEKK